MSQDNQDMQHWWEERIAKEAAEKDAATGNYNPPPSEFARQIYDDIYSKLREKVISNNKKDIEINVFEVSERTFYKDQFVHITNTRAVFGSTTFPISNINSVSIVEKASPKSPLLSRFGAFLLLIGIILLFIGGGTTFISFIGFVVFILGIILLAQQKAQYIANIGIPSGEVDAYISEEKQSIQKVVDAINKAISSQSHPF